MGVHDGRIGLIAVTPSQVKVYIYLSSFGVSQGAQWKGICLPMQGAWVQSLGWDDPLEKEMATHSSVLPWEIPWAEEPGGLQAMGVAKSQTLLSN